MTKKDPRFDPKLLNSKKDERKEDKIISKEIANSSILSNHLADSSVTSDKIVNGAITSNKLTSISIPAPFHSAYHLSGTTSGWVRIAQLKNLSSVEFWLKISISGHHAMSKIVGNYTFMGGSPSASFTLVSNSRYGTGYTDVRVLYRSTYDPVYFEVFLPQTAYIAVGQVSAFGETYANFSNITMETGSIPSGYGSDQQAWGAYDAAIIMV